MVGDPNPSTGEGQIGAILIAQCDCGFRSEELYTGFGFDSFEDIDIQPAACLNCGILLEVDVNQGKAECPICGKEMRMYDDPWMQEGGEMRVDENDLSSIIAAQERIRYLCPRCKRMSMRFIEVGFWD